MFDQTADYSSENVDELLDLLSTVTHPDFRDRYVMVVSQIQLFIARRYSGRLGSVWGMHARTRYYRMLGTVVEILRNHPDDRFQREWRRWRWVDLDVHLLRFDLARHQILLTMRDQPPRQFPRRDKDGPRDVAESRPTSAAQELVLKSWSYPGNFSANAQLSNVRSKSMVVDFDPNDPSEYTPYP